MLDHVSVGQPHTDAHNAERDRINFLDGSVTTLQTVAAANTQRARQDSDSRWRLPLNTEATLTATATLDATLTKIYQFANSGANLTGRIATQAEIDAFPVDFGQPSSVKDLYLSGAMSYFWNIATNDRVTSPPPTNTFRLMPSELRFRTNATKVQVLLYRLQGTAIDGHQVFVDGLPVTLRPAVGSAVVDYVTITFTDSKTREIAIRTTAGVGAFYIAPNFDIWRPEPRNGPVFYVTGDSYSDPVIWTDNGLSNGIMLESLGMGIGDGCGASDHYVDAIGGTGFIKTTTGAESNSGALSNSYEARQPQLVAAATAAWNNNQQDFIWVIPNGAVNDVGNYGTVVNGVTISQQTVVDAFRRMASALRAVHPKAKIIWGDGFTPPYSTFVGAGPNFTALREAVRAQCSDLGIYFVDTSNWIKGTGYLGSPVNVTGTTTVGSPIMTGTGYSAAAVGAPVSGTGIPAGTYILSWQSSTQVTLSANVTVASTNGTFSVGTTRMDGNSSLYVGADQVHLNGLGYRYLRGRYLSKIRRILVDTGTILNQVI